MPSVVSGKATKPSFETSSIILGKRVCGWCWKEASCQVARFSKYKYRCPVKFELEENNEIYMCVKYVPCNIWNLLTFKKMVLCLYNGNLAGQPIFYLETLIWKNSWDIPGMWHILSSVSLVLKYSYYQIIGKLDTA